MAVSNEVSENGSVDARESDHAAFQLHSRIAADDSYILDLALERQSYSSFAVALSNRNIKLFSAEQDVCTREFLAHDKATTKVKFSCENVNLLYSSSLDGTIKLWDLRTKNAKAQEFVDKTDTMCKAIASFDYNCGEDFLCGGTELVHEDAFLLFWDRRTTKILGGYWNSHTDDITQVICHPHKRSIMATGSVDGLMNVFDLNQSCEDDALTNTLNTGSSVGHMMWNVKNVNNMDSDQLACLTHTEEIQLWNVIDVSPKILFDRDFLKQKSKVNVDYLIGTVRDDDSVFLVSGSHDGNAQIWEVVQENASVWAQLDSGHKDDIRAVAWNSKDKTIFTGGEDGVVCIWKRISSSDSKKYKMASHLKKLSIRNSTKPY